MKLTYIYHSGYLLEGSSVDVLVDYYEDSSLIEGVVEKKLKESSKPLYILSTHSHSDHFNPVILSWNKNRENIRYILSKEILDAGLIDDISVIDNNLVMLDKEQVYEDINVSIKAYGSTDIGGSFFIQFDNKLIFHAGDLNNWHWNEESTNEESKEYEDNYLKELELLSSDIKKLDLAMLPIDPHLGKDYARGVFQFLDDIETEIVAPMHFHDQYDKVKDISEAVEKNYNSKLFIPLKRGDSINF